MFFGGGIPFGFAGGGGMPEMPRRSPKDVSINNT